LLATDVITVVY